MANLQRPKGPDYKYQSKNKWYPEAASQTFVKADWVYLVSGKVTICAVASNEVGNISILGRAAAKASGVVDTMLPVEVSIDGSEWLLPVYHGTPASAVLAVTDVGLTYPMRNQGGVWCFNKQTVGTNNRFKLTSIDSQYPVGEVYGTAWGNVAAANRQVQ